jgi:hypothetical protein
MVDIVGLYLNPPENALVLSVDEKTQIQALDRTQPELPLRSGNPRRLTTVVESRMMPFTSVPGSISV